jgi:hypothetical protein
VFVVGQDVSVQKPLTNNMVKGTITAYDPVTNSYSVFIDPDTIQVNITSIYLVKC